MTVSNLLSYALLALVASSQPILIKRDDEFPTSIGYLGTFTTGSAPFLAQTDDAAAVTGTPTSSYTMPQPLETNIQGSDSSAGDKNIFELMGTYSPYHVPSSPWDNVYDYALPNQCRIVQAHSLSRHGSRYDTSESKLPAWIKANPGFTASGDLEFLNTWSLNNGLAELGTYGNQQLFDQGVNMFFRYGALLNYTSNPDYKKVVARATSLERVTSSAEYFLNGFFGLNWQNFADLEVQIQQTGFNSTLYPDSICPAKTISEADDISSSFEHTYLHSTKKNLNNLVSGAQLSNKEVFSMQRLCTFETNTLGYSKFCNLFTQEDWQNWEVLKAYKYYYENGYGNPTSKARGIGWIDEFASRLTGKPFNTSKLTSQNLTFDSDSSYFPVDQNLYLDFSHDTVIVNILTALDLDIFKVNYQVDKKQGTIQSDNDNWRVSDIVPFAGHLVFEVIECDEPVPSDRSAESQQGQTIKYVHALLNDRTLPLDQRSISSCAERADGWCEFNTFVSYLESLHDEAMFDYSCYGSYSSDPVTNGVPSTS
ncbi:hypothetical protein DASC09_047070 [Saccharomycopsis crataegensis]|uniref:3-phytase n=1 Tax=Saccharomycopsis crataegensis TaxID=43959 RepID=A0AAV5QS20_9ASCO|nr:hypothetical protein DASC09_047070 [Saccharomycopsis crataegensis]